MGNGAAIYSKQAVILDHNYKDTEELCRSGYYAGNSRAFEDAIKKAIIDTRLDILEILIPSGSCKDVFPLHIAAGLGNLESLELLISAGFDICQLNRLGVSA